MYKDQITLDLVRIVYQTYGIEANDQFVILTVQRLLAALFPNAEDVDQVPF